MHKALGFYPQYHVTPGTVMYTYNSSISTSGRGKKIRSSRSPSATDTVSKKQRHAAVSHLDSPMFISLNMNSTFIEHLLMLATASRLRDEAENTPCPQSIHPSSFSLLSFCLYNRPFTSGSYGPPCILYPVPCMLHPSLHNPASHQTLVLLPLTHNHAL